MRNPEREVEIRVARRHRCEQPHLIDALHRAKIDCHPLHQQSAGRDVAHVAVFRSPFGERSFRFRGRPDRLRQLLAPTIPSTTEPAWPRRGLVVLIPNPHFPKRTCLRDVSGLPAYSIELSPPKRSCRCPTGRPGWRPILLRRRRPEFDRPFALCRGSALLCRVSNQLPTQPRLGRVDPDRIVQIIAPATPVAARKRRRIEASNPTQPVQK